MAVAKHQPGSRKKGFWWLAAVILLIGGTIAYLLSMNKGDPSARMFISITFAATFLGVGICTIFATSDWWFRR